MFPHRLFNEKGRRRGGIYDKIERGRVVKASRDVPITVTSVLPKTLSRDHRLIRTVAYI